MTRHSTCRGRHKEAEEEAISEEEEEEVEATLPKIANHTMNPRRTSSAIIATSSGTINLNAKKPRRTSNATTATSLDTTNPSVTRSKGRRIKQAML